MAETPSTMLPLGTPAPDFTLPDTGGNLVSLGDLSGAPGVAVLFISNHCPYVIHIRDRLAGLAREYMARGIAFVAIGSNDVSMYPQDGPEKMKEEKERVGYPFPYLYDETQEVARAYRAACTPDIYLFDADLKLVYRGQFDASRPGRGAPTGEDLQAAMDSLLAGEMIPEDQIPSVGCNIKWKPGNAPDYYG